MIKILGCQFNITWENKQANFEKVEKLLTSARLSDGSLVVLPEMAFTGFSMRVPAIADGEPAHTAKFLARMAKRLQVYIISGLVTQTPNGAGRNEAIFVTPQGEIEGHYQKLHLFSPAGEHSYFEPGNRVVAFEWQGGLVAPFICYDLRFPEAFRAAAGLGAEVFVIIANWPRVRERHWLALLQARAIENQAYVAGVNRCGSDPQHEYSGRSAIISPNGDVLADAGAEECVIGADLDWAGLREYRHRFPALRDRRSDGTFASGCHGNPDLISHV